MDHGILAHLDSPFSLGALALKNRMAVLPMGPGLAAPDGTVTDALVQFTVRYAEGGIGLVLTEGTCPDDKESRVLPVGAVLVHDDKCIPGLTKLATAVKSHGAAIICQLAHAGGSTRPEIIGGLDPVAPSANPTEAGGVMPKALDKAKIDEIAASFVQAGRRLHEAGFDGVELNGAHHLLFMQFLSPRVNLRTDEYGGPLQNRARVVLDILKGLRAATSPDFVIGYRMCTDERVPGGITYDEVLRFARMLEAAGCDYISTSSGTGDSPLYMFPTEYMPAGINLHLATGIKMAVNIPVLCGGSMNVETAAQAVASGKIDLAGFGRSMLADPDLPKKVAERRPEDIRPCVRCNRCVDDMIQAIVAGTPIDLRCILYPRVAAVQPAARPKKVVVVGGGPAGMEAARVAAARGHKVTLMERSDRLGGHLLEAVAPDFKSALRPVLDWLKTGLEKSGVEIRLNCEADAAAVRAEAPEAVIVAVGSDYIVPPALASDAPAYLLPDDVLQGRVTVGDRVVVAGGGTVGCETAIYAAGLPGRKVVLIEMLDSILKDETNPWAVMAVTDRLHAAGVEVRTGVRFDACLADGAACTERSGTSALLEADTVVLALGLRAREDAAGRFDGIAPEVVKVGDCVTAKDLKQAFESAWRVATI